MTEAPRLDEAVRRAVYRHFVEAGAAPALIWLADAVGAGQAELRASLRRLADAHILVLHPGTDEVWMAMPFSAVATGFRVRSASRAWWANCAWDALGIPAAINADAEIDARCALDGEPLPLRVRRGDVEGAAFLHFAVPAAHWWDDIGFT